MKISDIKELEIKANHIRRNIIEQIYAAKSGHPGGALSCTDILTALYFNQMNIDEKKPNALQRDRFVLSKGHASPALYATLAERGYFSKNQLKTFRSIQGNLQGHPDMNKVKGVDATTGSLGQGLSIANGMAMNSKINHDGYRVYCLLGDGEIEEGQVWEAAMTASHYQLDNLCVIVDNNNLQIDGNIEDVAGLTHIEEKFKSFGFKVLTIDGHNFKDILEAFQIARQTKGRPTVIVAKTVKGKGVSFMENQAGWHGKAPNEEQYKQAIMELSNAIISKNRAE